MRCGWLIVLAACASPSDESETPDARSPCHDGAYSTGDVCFDDGTDLVAIDADQAGLTVADLDHDGAIDLLIGRGGPGENKGLEIEFNDGATFSHVSVALPTASGLRVPLAVGDLDGDQDLDVVVALDDKLLIIRNGGGRHLTVEPPITIEAGIVVDVAIGDFDGDGDTDIATANRTSVSVIRGALQQSTSVAARELATGDFTGDGKLDIAALDGTLAFVSVTSELEVRSFGPIGDLHGMRAADINADGRLDLVIGARVLIADGESFHAVDVPLTGAALPLDVDGDGNLDLTDLDHDDRQWLTHTLLGRGDGTFGAMPVAIGVGPGNGSCLLCDGRGFADLRSGDLDGDGVIDLVALGGDATWGGIDLHAIRILRGAP